MVTGAANALNQVFEKDYDKLMKRTSNRPVAAGRMEVAEAVLLSGLMSVSGLLLLATFNANWFSYSSLSESDNMMFRRTMKCSQI